jgi:outer membrane protein OmpA-like peptidoglycan-associated protein
MREKREEAMKTHFGNTIPGHIAGFTVASAFAISLSLSAAAQSSGASQPADSVPPSPSAASMSQPAHEGFWGKMNPFARKKWVRKQLDPVKGQLNELDEVNAKNAQDIEDVDSRAQAGIGKAQQTAANAGQVATAAGIQAAQAHQVAGQASTEVAGLTTTVNGLDQYSAKSTVSIAFRSGSAVLSAAAKKKLDDLASGLSGEQGYILEMEAYAPLRGSAGVESFDRLAAAVKRYLVTEHEIPVYRMHSVALGNVPAAGTGDSKPVRTSYVELRLMENSLAAQDAPTPRFGASQTGASRP